jgi:type II secretory pathway pseudopilin PulG
MKNLDRTFQFFRIKEKSMMKLDDKKRQSGVSLVEILLVMVIISAFLMTGTSYLQQRANNLRLDRTALQMQGIMTSAMAYYVINGTWPADIQTLTTANFFPSNPVSPWGQAYGTSYDSNNFYVWTMIKMSTIGVAGSYAKQISGKLPAGYVSSGTAANSSTLGPPLTAGIAPLNNGIAHCAPQSLCYVVASVSKPGQSAANASSMNFAGLYHHGACVPVPTCPPDPNDINGNPMIPSVFIVPVSVSGVNDANIPSSNVYPISSFTGYATGGGAGEPPGCTGSNSPPLCNSAASLNGPPSTSYWRACLDVVTERGDVSDDGSSGAKAWGQYVTLMALTRCAPRNQEAGSDFSVYSN